MLGLGAMQAAPMPVAHVVAEGLFESGERAGQSLSQGLRPSLAGRQQRRIAALNSESCFEVDKTPVGVAAVLCEQGQGVAAEQVLRDVVAK